MNKRRNKTNRRQLPCLVMLAAAALLTVGASATGWAAVTPNPIVYDPGDVTVSGDTLAPFVPVDWDGDVGGKLTFGHIYDSLSNPAQAYVTVNGNRSAGSLSNNGGNAGVIIQVFSGNLSIGGDITATTGSNVIIRTGNGRTFEAANATIGAGIIVLGDPTGGNITVGTADGGEISNEGNTNTFTVGTVSGNLAADAINKGAGTFVVNNVTGGENTFENTIAGSGQYSIGTISAAGTNKFLNNGTGTYEITGDITGGTANEYTQVATGKGYTVTGEIKGGTHIFTNNSTDAAGLMTLGAISGGTVSLTKGAGAMATTADEVTGTGVLTVVNGAEAKSVYSGGTVFLNAGLASLNGGATAKITAGTTAAQNTITIIDNTKDTAANIVKGDGTNNTDHGVTITDIAGQVTIGTVAANEEVQAVVTTLSNGAEVVLSNGSALNNTVGTIGAASGDVIKVENQSATTNALALGTLKSGVTLTYNGTGTGGVIGDVAIAEMENNATIDNVAADAKLAVTADLATGDTATFKGAGQTSVSFAGNGNTVKILGGNLAVSNSTTLAGLEMASAAANNAVINTGANTVTLSGDVDLYGGAGSIAVKGKAIEVDNNDINLKDGGIFTFDFNGATGQTGYSGANNLNISTNGTIVDFTGNDNFLAVKNVNVEGTTRFAKDFTVTKTTVAAGSGIYTAALNINAGMILDGSEFTVTADAKGSKAANDQPLVIDGAGVGHGHTAITSVNGGTFDIAADTFFDVRNQILNTVITVVAGDNASAALDSLNYWRGNDTWINDSGITYYYDSTSGFFGAYDPNYVNSAFNGHAPYASRYINALRHYNPTGSVFMGNSSDREITMAMGNTLNAALMMINNPLDGVFRNNNLHPQTESRLARSAGDGERFGLWLSPNASFRSVDGDYSQGYGDFDVKSYGVTLGFDGWVNDQLRLGLLAGVNSSKLDGDFENIDGDDFQLGVYGQAFLPQNFRLNLGLAYSWQNYEADRQVDNTADNRFNQRIKSDFDGDTFIAALELSKSFALDCDLFLRPGLGYTYLGTTLDAYGERSSLLPASQYNLAQQVDETDFDLHLFRVGTDLGWTSENAAVIGRAYYVGNAGDNQPTNTARFRYANAGVPSFNVYGAEYDDHMANLGLTAKVAPSDNTHLAIDYDALLGSNSTTHNVNLTFNYEW